MRLDYPVDDRCKEYYFIGGNLLHSENIKIIKNFHSTKCHFTKYKLCIMSFKRGVMPMEDLQTYPYPYRGMVSVKKEYASDFEKLLNSVEDGLWVKRSEYFENL